MYCLASPLLFTSWWHSNELCFNKSLIYFITTLPPPSPECQHLFVCFSDFFWTKLFVLFSKDINLKHVFTSQTYRYLSQCWWVTFNFPTHILRICVCVEIKLNDWFVSLISCSTVQKTRVCWLQDFIYDARFVATSCSVAMQKCKTCKISRTVSHWSLKVDLQIF